MLPTRTTGDPIDGHWKLLICWNAVPRMLVWDNEAGIGRGKVTTDFAAFAGPAGTGIAARTSTHSTSVMSLGKQPVRRPCAVEPNRCTEQ
ncbi:hypothetical protein ABZ565_33610 [Streptomyces sp. NPDC016469]|uniref:hypothetical protein n=1 Tax=Streptomyces sp. NPDC016469 TaxID=3157191 RepID=UPI00340A8ED5